ncbi:MAG: MBL fold metallo-hydrolase [Clostridia bacterium]|nr:MBL fold metallo-hydrolase [Clostridia bacterium]
MRKSKGYRKEKALGIVSAVVFVILAVLYLVDALFTPKHKVVHAECEIHFVDVGQGDCTMVISDENVIVVDCGPRESAKDASEYIKSYTDTIDYLVLTHPHEDHIGGAEQILEDISVENVIMSDAVTDTLVFDSLLCALDENNVNVIEAFAGNSYAAGKLDLSILSPAGEMTNLNDYSIVARISYMDVSVMVTGDVEHNSEKAIVDAFSKKDIESELLKVSHHGSSTSNHESFVKAVDPEFAVIQCGEDNSYGHPHREIIDLLNKLNIEYYRTDEEGSVVFVTDGIGVELKDQ